MQALAPKPLEKPLSLEDLARIRAEIEAGRPRQEVLEEAGLSDEAFAQAEARALETISAAASRGSLSEARRFVSLLHAERQRVATGQTQTFLAKAKQAASVALPLPNFPLPPLPLEKAARPQATPIPAEPRAPEKAPPPRPPKHETMAMPAFDEDDPPDSDGLPFQKPAKKHETMAMPAFDEDDPPDSDGLPFIPAKPGAAPAFQRVEPPRAPAQASTGKGQPKTQPKTMVGSLHAPQAEALPFQRPSPTGPPAPAPLSEAMQARVQAMSLAAYARLCADVRKYPQHIAQVRAHYGLDEAGWAALHLLWRERFEESPNLRAKWQALIAQHTQTP